jgi:hypothetical protein
MQLLGLGAMGANVAGLNVGLPEQALKGNVKIGGSWAALEHQLRLQACSLSW